MCGVGSQLCENGFWSVCVVPDTERPCENTCGEGSQTCHDGAWGQCEVEPVSLACDDECGAGEQTCIDGLWSECVVPTVERPCESVCGVGTETCSDGAWINCTAPTPLPPRLTATIRDFRENHPDFELPLAGIPTNGELGIVEDQLGADGKPVYANNGSLTTTNQANFDQWFRDVPGVNMSTTIELPLSVSPNDSALFVYDNPDFFPIDGQFFGNESFGHNYHFTLEASGTFTYVGGETFRFRGDDDVWVFINGFLVIDLGGLHEALEKTVELDDIAAQAGMVKGGDYMLHIFFAERHSVSSNFIVETSVADAGSCPGVP